MFYLTYTGILWTRLLYWNNLMLCGSYHFNTKVEYSTSASASSFLDALLPLPPSKFLHMIHHISEQETSPVFLDRAERYASFDGAADVPFEIALGYRVLPWYVVGDFAQRRTVRFAQFSNRSQNQLRRFSASSTRCFRHNTWFEKIRLVI